MPNSFSLGRYPSYIPYTVANTTQSWQSSCNAGTAEAGQQPAPQAPAGVTAAALHQVMPQSKWVQLQAAWLACCSAWPMESHSRWRAEEGVDSQMHACCHTSFSWGSTLLASAVIQTCRHVSHTSLCPVSKTTSFVLLRLTVI